LASHVLRHWCTILVLAGVCACLLSCSSYESMGGPDELDAAAFREGDELLIHLTNGRVLNDVFVEMDDTELVCESNAYALDTIRDVERRGPLSGGDLLGRTAVAVLGFAATVAVLAGLFALAFSEMSLF